MFGVCVLSGRAPSVFSVLVFASELILHLSPLSPSPGLGFEAASALQRADGVPEPPAPSTLQTPRAVQDVLFELAAVLLVVPT